MDKRDEFALVEVFKALHAVGVTVDNGKEAAEAVDLAARMLGYILKRAVSVDDVKSMMLELMLEDTETEH